MSNILRLLNTFKTKSLRLFNLASFLLLCLSINTSISAQDNTGQRPNIIFILSDDHASAAISSYGSKIISTPNIDRIAREGVRFTNAFVTSSLCAPSRAAMLTSKYGEKSGFRRIGDTFDGQQVTFPKLLQNSGYETAIFGKWHLRSRPTGFDHFEVIRDQDYFFDPTFYSNDSEWKKNWKGNHKNSNYDSSGIMVKGHFTDIITEKSIKWMDGRTSTEPFALFIHHKSPHNPHITPKKYDSLFSDELPVPATFNDSFSDNSSIVRKGKASFSKIQNAGAYDIINSRKDWERILDGTYTPPFEKGTKEYKDWAFQTMYKGYYRQIKSLDDSIGNILDYLQKIGVRQNTIIIYASDNGWFLGDFGFYNKMWMYEQSLKIPLIISYPNKLQGNIVDDNLVSALDLAPTILDFAKVDIPPDFQGKSLKQILEGKKPKNWRDAFYYHYYDQFDVPEQYGIRTKKYKLIKMIPEDGEAEFELYDLKKDSMELLNRYNDLEYIEIGKSLKERLSLLKKNYED